MNRLLAHDHAELSKLLDEVCAVLKAGDVKRSHAQIDLFWARLAVHIRAEHLHLFPAILGAANRKGDKDRPSLAQAEEAIEGLRRDHDFFMRELASAMVSLRELLPARGRQPEPVLAGVWATVGAVKERLAIHTRLEEGGVYLWTGQLLTTAQQSVLADRMNGELSKMPRRFRKGKGN